MQRLVKRRHESTCRLDLRLDGLLFDSVSMVFNQAHSLNPVQDASADKTRTETAIMKAEKGILSPDEAAQELGYDSCYDASLMMKDPEAVKALQSARQQQRSGSHSSEGVIQWQFDSTAQKYKAVLPRIEIATLTQAAA